MSLTTQSKSLARVIGAVVAIFLAVWMPRAAAAATATNILWISGHPADGDGQLWLTDSTGSHAQLISAKFAPKAYPAFVDNGVIYGTAGVPGDIDLMRVGPDGSTTKATDLCPGEGLLRVGPAGAGRMVVACGSLSGPTSSIDIENLDGTSARRAATGLTGLTEVASDGRNVAYTILTGPSALFTAPVSSWTPTQLSTPFLSASGIGPSPVDMSAASGVLAYLQASHVVSMPITGGTPQVLTGDAVSNTNAAISPDGTAVLYSGPSGPCTTDTHVISVSGGAATLLTGKNEPYVPDGQCGGAGGMWAPGMTFESSSQNGPAVGPQVVRVSNLQTHRSGHRVTLTARITTGRGTVQAVATSGRRRVTLQVSQSKTGAVTMRAKLAPGVWKIRITVKPARSYTAPKPQQVTVRI